MDVAQFAITLKNAGLSQKMIELKQFNGKLTDDPLDWLREFNRDTEVNNWLNKQKLSIIGNYLKENAKYWFNKVAEILYWNETDYSEDLADGNKRNFEDLFKNKFIIKERKTSWFTQMN